MTMHSWRFFVAGGVNQVKLETAEDLRHLRELDPKLWVALCCPVRGHAMDERTMALVDSDHDGRVASPEGPLLAHARSGRSIRAGHGSAEPSPAEQLTSQRKRKQGAIVEKAGATQKKQPVLARQRQNWLASPEGPLLAHARSGRSIRAGHGSAEPSPAEQLTSQRKRKQGAIVEKAGATQKKQPVLARQRQNWLRLPEILAAVDFLVGVVKDPAEIFADPVALPLASIRDDGGGQTVLASARAILQSLGRPAALELRLADFADLPAIFAKMALNGDGVAHAGATADEDMKRLIGEIVAATGGEKDRSGEDGVSLAKAEQFFAACVEFAAWEARGVAEREVLFTLGEDTPAAVAALAEIAPKVDDYFARCRLVAFDGRRRDEVEAGDVGVGGGELSPDCREVDALPLARVQAGSPLFFDGPLAAGLNPAWAGRVAAFRRATVRPIVGDVTRLTEEDWTQVKARLAAPAEWRAKPGGGLVASLGGPRIGDILRSDMKERLLALIAADEACRPEAEAVGRVEQAVRYYTQLALLLRNFVNFRGFYGRREKAIFQAGTAYFDQRSFDLALEVEDPARHGLLAAFAGAYLAYLECTRLSDGRRMTVCVAVTDGDGDNLMVGRNGLFYDRAGRDYDARIVKIVDNPIGLRQAFWTPYKRFIRMIEEVVAKRAAAADAESTAKLGSAVQGSTTPAAPPVQKPIDIGTVAAIGVAVGGISAAIGALLQGFFGLGIWMPLGLVGLMLLISGPSVIIAAVKLRRRNLGPLLDADGWAVNTQARINIPLGRSLTSLATLPPGSSRDLRDDFAQKPSRWPYGVAFGLIVTMATFVLLLLTGNLTFLLQP